MTLEHPKVLRQKNRRRLRDLINISFTLGINVTAPTKLKSYLRIITVVLIIGSCGELYGQIMYIYRYRHNIFANAETICTCLQLLSSIIKLIYMVFVQHQFYKVLDVVTTHALVDKIDFLAKETPYNLNLRRDTVKILDHCWTFAKRQFNFYMIVCYSISTYYFFSIIVINRSNRSAFEPDINKSKYYSLKMQGLPSIFPLWVDKMNEYPYYQIQGFVSTSGIYIGGICGISFNGIFIIVALHVVALFRILRKLIIFTTSSHVPKELRLDYLRQCISHYERTYQYCLDFNNLYLHASLVQFLMSLILLGVVMFQAAFGLENDLILLFRMTALLSGSGFEVFMFCLNGQLISNASEAIPSAWYECEWYNESKEFKKLINMMILRTNRVTEMRASLFTTVSLPTCLWIYRTSYSYFLLLRNLSEA